MDNNRRRNEMMRKKLKRKRLRKRIVSFSVLIVIIGLMGLAIVSIKNKVDDQNKITLSNDNQTEVITEIVAGEKMPKFIVSDQNVKIDFIATVPEEINKKDLVKGYNFSLEAAKYAYDTDQVKKWTKGEEEYTGEKIAFLTFDDGPNHNSMKVMDILKERNVPGTFFILGKTLNAYENKEDLNRYITEGHSVAIHSYSHDYAYLYPGRVARPDRLVEEYNQTLDIMKDMYGDDFYTRVFRFPGGSMSWKNTDAAKDALKEIEVVDVDWNSMSGDAEPLHRRPATTEAMGRYVLETLKQNRNTDVAVVLMHDVIDRTPEYLNSVIDNLEKEGFTFGVLK
ncbi:MAG: polysaccharide deacetylase family protein [Clostridium sp.]|nr:polysaccharide deacetylase family protein [Clostridium sp.]